MNVSRWPAALALALVASTATAHEGHRATKGRLDERIAHDPADREARLERASLARRRGDHAAALRDLAWIAKASPDDPRLWLERGLTRFELDQHASASADLARFVEHGGKNSEAHRARAAIARRSGKLEQAYAELDAAYRLRPTPDAALERGALDEATGRLDRAATDYCSALEALSGAHTVRMALVRVERARKAHDAAIRALDPAIRDDGLAPSLLLLRAELRDEAGDPAGARRDRDMALARAEAAVAARPTSIAKVTHARALAAVGRRDEAIAALDEVVRVAPANREARELLDGLRRRGARGGAR
jgi:tetratricopeptide (TPR) repeat protein